jgi:hypothetical protein
MASALAFTPALVRPTGAKSTVASKKNVFSVSNATIKKTTAFQVWTPVNNKVSTLSL